MTQREASKIRAPCPAWTFGDGARLLLRLQPRCSSIVTSRRGNGLCYRAGNRARCASGHPWACLGRRFAGHRGLARRRRQVRRRNCSSISPRPWTVHRAATRAAVSRTGGRLSLHPDGAPASFRAPLRERLQRTDPLWREVIGVACIEWSPMPCPGRCSTRWPMCWRCWARCWQ